MAFIVEKSESKVLKNVLIASLLTWFVFTTVSLVFYHLSFRTHAYDFGIEAGTARNVVMHGAYYDSVMNTNLLGDHFSPALIIPGLLYFIWDNPITTLIFQNICMFLGLFVAYKIALQKLKNDNQALFLTLLLSFNVYLHEVNLFPFHIETMGIVLLLLIIYLIEQKRSTGNLILVILLTLGVALVKEDLPLALGGFGLWLIIFNKEKRLEGTLILALSLVSFLLIATVFIPHFSGGHYTHASRYANFGSSTGEIIRNILTRPDMVIKNLFTPTKKLAIPILLFASFLFIPAFSKEYMLTFIVPLFYHLISSYAGQWKLLFQYSVPILPFIFYATIYGFKNLVDTYKNTKNKNLKITMNIYFYLIIGLMFVSFVYEGIRYTNNFIRFKPRIYNELHTKIIPSLDKKSTPLVTGNLYPHFIGFNKPQYLGQETLISNQVDYVVIRKITKDRPSPPWPWKLAKYKKYLDYLDKNFVIKEDANYFRVYKISQSADSRK